MEDYVIKTVILSVFSWATLFLFITRILSNRSFNFRSRTVSIFHAFLAVTMASLCVQDWTCPLCPLASKPSPHQNRTLAITSGYMIYDLVCCLYNNELKADDLVHHLVTIFGLGAGLAYQRCGSEMVGALWVSEISGPSLHLRELLKELGYRDTALNLAVDICFAVIFSLSRMIGGTYLTYIVVSSENPILIKAMSVGMLAISAFWFYKIVRMVIYKLSKKSKTKGFTSKSL